METIFREDGATIGVTLYISESATVRDYYGTSDYLTFLHVPSNTRYAAPVRALEAETPDTPQDVYLAEYSSTVPLGEYRLEGSATDFAGNSAPVTGEFTLKRNRVRRWLNASVVDHATRYDVADESTVYSATDLTTTYQATDLTTIYRLEVT